jgi:Protein of unknown function (DUF2971)
MMLFERASLTEKRLPDLHRRTVPRCVARHMNDDDSLPVMLFHYTTLAGVCRIATSRTLWATSIRHLADATEYTYAHGLLSRALEGAVSGRSGDLLSAVEFLVSDLDARSLQQALNFGGSLGTTYVVSLSGKPDQLSQWRTYCPGGGYSLGFRTEALRAIAERQGFELIKCSYSSQEHQKEAKILAEAVIQQVEEVQADAGVSFSAEAVNGNTRLLHQLLFPVRRRLLEEMGSLMHLFEVQRISCPQYIFSETPYRHW